MSGPLALPAQSHSALDDALIILRLAFIYALLGLISHWLARGLIGLTASSLHIDTQFLLIDALFAGLIIVGSLLAACLLKPAGAMRWLWGPWRPARGPMIAMGLAVLMVLLANPLADWVNLHIQTNLPWPETSSAPRAVTPLLDLPAGRLLLALLITIVWVPLAEELVFRGWLFQGLAATRPGLLVALPSTTLIFTLLHSFYSPGGMLVIALLGLLLGWLRWRYQQLWPCILAHALYNGLTLLLVALT